MPTPDLIPAHILQLIDQKINHDEWRYWRRDIFSSLSFNSAKNLLEQIGERLDDDGFLDQLDLSSGVIENSIWMHGGKISQTTTEFFDADEKYIPLFKDYVCEYWRGFYKRERIIDGNLKLTGEESGSVIYYLA